MKVVIFCGGRGSRLNEFTEEIPKPLVEIGNKPVLWHIMKIYSAYGFKDFILCLGYKGEKIKDYFIKSDWRENDFTLKEGKIEHHSKRHEDWTITFVDTGQDTNKAERLMKVRSYLADEEDFFVTYGDDVSDVNLIELLEFHKRNGKIATITTNRPENPYGIIELQGDLVINFREKPIMEQWVNSGFFVFNKRIFENINPTEDLEKEVFKRLYEKGEIIAFKNFGFWKGMNTFKDTQELNEYWKNKSAKWKKWMD